MLGWRCLLWVLALVPLRVFGEGEVLVKPPQDPFAVIEPETYKESVIKDTCKIYDASYISYYGRLFFVDDCKLREILGKSHIADFIAEYDGKISIVDGDVIAKIPEGKPYIDPNAKKIRQCFHFDGRYVLKGESIYKVDNCTYRQFPDFETYKEARQIASDDSPLMEISDAEMALLKQGRPFGSILPAVFAKALGDTEDVDTLPLVEACHKIEGKFVGYIDAIYRIDSCQKRLVVDIDAFLHWLNEKGETLEELTSEQWISLPDGEPWEFGH